MTAPTFTHIQLTGTPEEVGRLTELLGGDSEVNFLSRGGADARGEVTWAVQLIHPPKDAAEPHRQDELTTITMQAVVDIDPAPWQDLTPAERDRQLEQDTERVLGRVLPGSAGCRARVVSTRPARAPRA
jgi:hypothetical protein